MSQAENNNRQLFVGLMSGTSLDGIDAVLADFSDIPAIRILKTLHKPFNRVVRQQISSLFESRTGAIQDLCELDVFLGEAFSEAVLELLQNYDHPPKKILAIGSHGQTILHHSRLSARRYSLQIGDPNIIALRTGIPTVADFRRMDIAAGGEGAPLVPAFHDALLRQADENRVVVNIGGMANITVLAREQQTHGFDTGPGNVLLDAWIEQTSGKTFDTDGDWAAQGCINDALLQHWLDNSYFHRPPPKSTGRETFNLAWLNQTLECFGKIPPENVQRSLTELTAITITDSIKRTGLTFDKLILCGGGAHNKFLRQRIAALLPQTTITDTGFFGLDPDWVEATAFAWLARQRLMLASGNIPAVTGASQPCILGGLYLPHHSEETRT